MNLRVDLMPESCRATLRRRRAIRRWAITIALAIAALGVGEWWLSSERSSRAREARRLGEEVRAVWEQNEEAQQLVKQIREVEEAIGRYDRLAWPIRVTEVVAALGSAMPESATLTLLAMTPHEERAPRRVKEKGKAAPPPAPPRVVLLIELEGVAPGDGDVAQLIEAMDAHPLFSKVTLDYARSRDVDGVEARAFRATCEVDLSVRYELVEAAEEGAQG